MWVRILSFCIVVLFVGIACALWWIDGTAPVNAQNQTPERFVIRKGEPVKSIASRLSEQNLIRSPTAFFVLVKIHKIDGKIQAGEFRLNQSMDARMVADQLQHGMIDAWITTLEGWRIDEIANKLAKELDVPEKEFLSSATEGYMFPDTYLIPRTASASAIADLFLRTFNTKVTQKMHDDVESAGLTLHEAVTLASIIEREGKTDSDRPVIAGILLNRLRNNWPLQADATVQYVLGYQPQEKTWWKKYLTKEDLAVNSPYNTYIQTGLPPGPISNPGLSSIMAAVYPEDTDYWYYLHDPSGAVHFARTLDEHNENIRLYLRD